MTTQARKIISGLLAVALLATQLLMAQHMAAHLDEDARLSHAVAHVTGAQTPGIHHRQQDDDHCAVCFFAKFIFLAMAVAFSVLMSPSSFRTRMFFPPQRFPFRHCFCAYDACGPPLFPA